MLVLQSTSIPVPSPECPDVLYFARGQTVSVSQRCRLVFIRNIRLTHQWELGPFLSALNTAASTYSPSCDAVRRRGQPDCLNSSAPLRVSDRDAQHSGDRASALRKDSSATFLRTRYIYTARSRQKQSSRTRVPT